MDALDATGTAIYRSETRRVAVEVIYSDGTVLAGDVYLQPNTMLTEGFESLLELLNRPDSFFAMTIERKQVVLLCKEHVAVVACALENRKRDDDFPGTITELDVWLAGGGRYQGTATWQLPPAHSRPLDFLNTVGRFLEISDESYSRYINVGHVRAVYPGD